MRLFAPARGSIGDTIRQKTAHVEKTRGRSASQIQAKKAKKRKKEIETAKKQKKQDERDIRRAKLLSFNGPPSAGKAAKFNKKAIEKGDKRRAKKAAKKAANKGKFIYWS